MIGRSSALLTSSECLFGALARFVSDSCSVLQFLLSSALVGLAPVVGIV